MREDTTLEDINTAFEVGDIDYGEILNTDEPLEVLYEESESDDTYEPQSKVAQEYLPETDKLL